MPPILLLVDQRGMERWRHSGAFEEKAYCDLLIEVAALVKSRN
jgi:hypothetical protein